MCPSKLSMFKGAIFRACHCLSPVCLLLLLESEHRAAKENPKIFVVRNIPVYPMSPWLVRPSIPGRIVKSDACPWVNLDAWFVFGHPALLHDGRWCIDRVNGHRWGISPLSLSSFYLATLGHRNEELFQFHHVLRPIPCFILISKSALSSECCVLSCPPSVAKTRCE